MKYQVYFNNKLYNIKLKPLLSWSFFFDEQITDIFPLDSLSTT